MMRGLPPLALAATLLGSALAPSAVQAQATGDVSSLGRGARSGAVCRAVRDYDDPVAQTPGGRAWIVRCLGWDTPIGRLYATSGDKALGSWRTALAKRATCGGDTPATLAGLSDVHLRTCRLTANAAPYAVYEGRRGGRRVAGEGYASAADVLETGVRVAAGAAKPPPSVEVQPSAASAEVAAAFGGDPGGLGGGLEAAARDPQRLRARGYVQNNEWRFGGAETDFRSLVAATKADNAPPAERAEALLNLALNVSNTGRFAEADALFAQADPLVAAANDPVFAAESLNYRALHLRTQRRYAEAVAMAQKAMSAREAVRRELQQGPQTPGPGGAVSIDATLSEALNSRSGGQDLLGGEAVSPAQRLQIQDAESLEIIGSAKLASGDVDGAADAFGRAQATLAEAQAGGVLNVRLRARVLADLGDLALARSQPGAAVSSYDDALEVLRTRYAGSSTEAGLLLDLGRAQIAAGQTDAAMATYGGAFELFRQSRGSLGDSADAAEPYFDLLLARSAADPAHARDYAARLFTAAGTVVSSATASTVSRLAARVASGDDATAGLVRAVDDLRRQVTAAESRIAFLQASDAYKGDAKAAADATLKNARDDLASVDGQLLSANPRYDQLVASTVTLDSLQPALRPGEAYLKTLMLADRGYGLLVTRDSATAYPIRMTRDEAVQIAAGMRAPFESATSVPHFSVKNGHALFEILMGPVETQVLAARHLVYEPDAALVSVPAAIMVTDAASVERMDSRTGAARRDYSDVSWLGRKLDSSLVLSAASFMQSRAFRPSAARQVLLGFGDPDLKADDRDAFRSVLTRSGEGLSAGPSADVCARTREQLLTLPALPDTATELRTVAAILGAPASDLVLGDRFTDAAVLKRPDLGDYRVLYFATHALLPMPEACLPEPALVTSPRGADSDGLLKSTDILQLKLDADLVVLSACDTGGAGGADVAQTGLEGGGQALGGLARAMIYAGARGLIVSHWEVDSAATMELMTSLFSSGAPSQAEALQQAQAKLQADPRTSHPYYWAAFTVVGDGARPMPRSADLKAAALKAKDPSASSPAG